MGKEFIIRSYGYGELAMLYFPRSTKKSASVQFRRWLILNNDLSKNLKSEGFRPGLKILTPKQVLTIINFLGEP